MKNLSGGAPRRKFFQQSWTLTVLKDEIVPQAETIEKLENDIEHLKEQVHDVTVQKKDALEKCEALTKKVAVISGKLRTATADGFCSTRGKKRSCTEYSKSHLRRLKRQRASNCEMSLSWLQLEGYTPARLELVNNETREVHMVALSKDILGNDEESISTDDIDILNMMILVKDQYNVSGRAYHEMARICKEMPRHYRRRESERSINCGTFVLPLMEP